MVIPYECIFNFLPVPMQIVLSLFYGLFVAGLVVYIVLLLTECFKKAFRVHKKVATEDDPALASRKVYLSGPITGMPEDNALAFSLASLTVSVSKRGIPINPLVLDHEGAITWLDYMKTCIKALVDCRAILMLKGWASSRGARVELILALLLGIKVYWSEKQFLSESSLFRQALVNERKSIYSDGPEK